MGAPDSNSDEIRVNVRVNSSASTVAIMEEPSTGHLNQLLREEINASLMEKTKEKLIAELAVVVVSYAEFRVVTVDELEKSFQHGDFGEQTKDINASKSTSPPFVFSAPISEVSADNLLISFESRGRIFCRAKWDKLIDQFIERIRPSSTNQSPPRMNTIGGLAWFTYLLNIPPDLFADEASPVANFVPYGAAMVSGVFCGYDFMQSCFTLEIKIIKRKARRVGLPEL